MKIGMTGHQQMPQAAVDYAAAGISRLLDDLSEPHGISSLAEGADQLFVRCLLRANRSFDLIVPSAEYERSFDDRGRDEYLRLAGLASAVTSLPFPKNSEEAFLAAGIVMVERSELVVAAWDGRPARGLGGTADVVAYARQLDKPVEVVWPSGVSR